MLSGRSHNVGNMYVVQTTQGQKAQALVTVKDGVLGEIGTKHIQTEGFASLKQFISGWEILLSGPSRA